MHQPGLRERKKQRTRLALIDAGLELFLAQGYEATTIDQIAAAADVSPRTFFRYFATKEDLALHYVFENEMRILAELATRPSDELPFASLKHAFRKSLKAVEDATPEDTQRMLRTRRLLDATPSLVGRASSRTYAMERRMAEEIARRQGVELTCDIRPMMIVALLSTTLRVAFECQHRELTNAKDLVAVSESAMVFLERSLVPGWDDLTRPS
ncbi:DNA-binding transcriptional regulator, AcrR family [Sinosporangium album]|uniref:DNA-binding transcriptional regulator, AcrR family n=1 Tax=Sinosporangium album TaxID=504805 RepID=A0A1G7V7X0_9ACTN|nr:TetR family transcriptional regulator [Sinosporangium album]SDG55060.1 DNA-binding transcriptional regulator, AcrR family [Sinosporangium album]